MRAGGTKMPAGPALKRAVRLPLTKLCRFTGLDSEPPTVLKTVKPKPQVERLRFCMKSGYGRGYRVKRSRWANFVASAIGHSLGGGRKRAILAVDLESHLFSCENPRVSTLVRHLSHVQNRIWNVCHLLKLCLIP